MESNIPPIHDFSKDDASSIPFKLLPLEQENFYNATIAHRHNYYEIFVFEQGGGKHHIDFSSFPILSNSIHFISPGQVHLVERQKGSSGKVIVFSRDFFLQNSLLGQMPFFNNHSIHPILNLSAAQFAPCIQLIKQITTEYEEQQQFQENALRSFLTVLLINCKRYFEANFQNPKIPLSKDYQLYQQFKTLIDQNFRAWHQVNNYAKELLVTDKYLSSISKKLVGQTGIQLIHQRIVLEAKRLLLHSNLSSKEIAYFLNFDDPAYFSKFFKRNTGLAPNAFKTTLGKNLP